MNQNIVLIDQPMFDLKIHARHFKREMMIVQIQRYRIVEKQHDKEAEQILYLIMSKNDR